MKKYKLILCIISLITSITGCYELDVFPEDQLSSENFFKTQNHADQAMMGVYSLMTDDDVFGIQFGFDCLGGVASGFDPASYTTIARGIYTTSEKVITNKFQKLYEGVARTNLILQNIDKCEMSNELKLRYEAEAKFMRALFYFTLMDFWGGVPIYDETTIVSEEFMNMLKPKSDIESVRNFILSDLKDAIDNLPIIWDDANKGRATSGAALALKGKVLLYAGKYDEAKTCFEDVCGEVPNSKFTNVYKLYEEGENPYSDLFKPGGDESSEIIFAVQNIGGVGQDFGMPTTRYMGTRSSFGGGWNSVMASIALVDSYEWKDGTNFSWTDSKPEYNWKGYPTFNDVTENDKGEKEYLTKQEIFYSKLTEDTKQVAEYTPHKQELLNMYANRDPRMMASVIMPYTKYKGWVNNKAKDMEFVITKEPGICNETNGFIRINGAIYEYYPFRKFVAEYDMNGEINNRDDTPINFPLIRLADIYLMLAECYIYSSEADLSKACSYINKVRDRKGVEMPHVNATTKEQAFKLLRHERAVELAAEGHSFSDMKRWKLLETLNGPVYGFAVYDPFYTRVVSERDYLWPFPQTECDKNPSLAKEQNPGW